LWRLHQSFEHANVVVIFSISCILGSINSSQREDLHYGRQSVPAPEAWRETWHAWPGRRLHVYRILGLFGCADDRATQASRGSVGSPTCFTHEKDGAIPQGALCWSWHKTTMMAKDGSSVEFRLLFTPAKPACLLTGLHTYGVGREVTDRQMIDPGLDLFDQTAGGASSLGPCQAREMAETAGPWASVAVGLDRLPLSSCQGLDIFPPSLQTTRRNSGQSTDNHR
jgi:hypothetical protein